VLFNLQVVTPLPFGTLLPSRQSVTKRDKARPRILVFALQLKSVAVPTSKTVAG
jgi:hypothetical protein